MTKPANPTRPQYYLARLDTDDDRVWNSLHVSHKDAERQLRAVGKAWDVGFTLDGEPADGFLSYYIEPLPVLTSEESDEPPDALEEQPVTREEYVTWTWLVDRDVPGGLSAEEMADDFGIDVGIAALRLVGITALDMAHEVGPGRYRCTKQGE